MDSVFVVLIFFLTKSERNGNPISPFAKIISEIYNCEWVRNFNFDFDYQLFVSF